jgi:hypothetical protein
LNALEKTSPQALLRAIVDEFDERGWRYVEGLPALIVSRAEESGSLDAAAAAQLADSKFLARNQTDRPGLEAALEKAFAGRELVPASSPANIKQEITINNYGTIGDISQVGQQIGQQIAQQITLNLDSPKEAVLENVAGLVRQALDTDLPEADLAELAGLVEARDDIGQGDVETVVGEVVAEVQPEASKLERLRERLKAGAGQVATSATTSLVVQGILAVLEKALGG